ncbi:hypothetical protein FPV67DRAFT_1113544 [Lyophyllum atratum]|nr:hypothetical protein FPV67DRAFT_1113544 [Lyophyllum atratum]
MFVPFFSVRSDKKARKLYRRKGGGGGGKGGGGGGKSGGSTGGTGSSGAGRSTPISSGGSSKSATSFGPGGGKSAPIPAGQPFAGRDSGGATRGQVYGNQQYGSGYPGVAGRGVAGRGFPFVFWPLAWGGVGGIGAAAYLHNSEYGRPNNSSRPGGPMAAAAFVSSTGNTTYRILSDNTTIIALISHIKDACSSNLNNGSSSSAPSPYQDSFSAIPQPEQTIQYYRASSIALTLDGYNNTGALGPDGTADTPLPNNIDTNLLTCLNQTIGDAAPLIGGVPGLSVPSMGLLGLLWVLWSFSSLF